ncbi:MAG TPA: LysR family transcriptional regulator [Verrucomicrobiae bacterium]|nr:LysR family transcriptional regulator [Verrucomicrobiae bacterium]
MELRQLRYFIAVAERLSFSKAAQHLHITVPPLSRQVRQLEEEFGVELFVRNRRNVALTDAGRTLLREAKSLVNQSAHVTDCVRLAKCGEAGLVKIGIGLGLGEPISRVFIEHSKQFPSVELQYRDMFSSWQNKALHDGDIDVGFLRPLVDSVHLMTEVLFQENFVVHLSRTNPLAKRKALRIKDLAGETLLVPNRGGSTGLYDKTLELYAEAGVTPNIVHVSLDPVPHSDTQIVLLTCHKGIFIMPDEVACRPAQGSEVVAVPLDEPNAKIDVHVAWRRGEKSTTVLGLVDSAIRVYSAPPRYCTSARGEPSALNSISQAERRS